MSDIGENLAGARPASRGEARRAAFLEAAHDVFLEQGYEAASVNEVVRRAGGSLATLYSQFGNKDGLFLAVVERATKRFTDSMMAAATDPDLPMASGLQTIGEHFLTSALQPRSLAFFRLVVGEGRKFPDVVSNFIRMENDRVRALIAEYLLQHSDREGLALTVQDAEACGSFFVDMVRARHQYRALANHSYTLSEDEIRAHVASAVRFILMGLLPRGKAS